MARDMNSQLISQLEIASQNDNLYAIEFCTNFDKDNAKRYVFGRNEFAESIESSYNIDGFIDDFTSELTFLGKPIIKLNELPPESMVVVSVIGRPFTASKKLEAFGICYLDYFSFKKYSLRSLLPVWYLDEFEDKFHQNFQQFENVFNLLCDKESKDVFLALINFKLTSNIKYLIDFKDTQYKQYFEDFLHLETDGESFVDVGSFDGGTSLEFIKRCPQYNFIHVIEPIPQNMSITEKALSKYLNIAYHNVGLSDSQQTIRFIQAGHSSKQSAKGTVLVKTDTLDNLIKTTYTFLKMDIEGSELAAIKGAKQSIIKNHPILAICVYHKCDDFWTIPNEILSYRKDYKLYMRHYNEGISETVMYFVPNIQNHTP